MGSVKHTFPVKLFAAVTFCEDIDIMQFRKVNLSDIFKEEECTSGIFNFSSFTSYYEKEMGSHLKKFFIGYKELVEPDQLPVIKISTNQLEARFSSEGKRRVNIDPGYLTLAKVVLATTKDFCHRLYLSDGIYGDVHLIYTNNDFIKQPWTYPDYQQDITRDFFINLRKSYAIQLSGVSV